MPNIMELQKNSAEENNGKKKNDDTTIIVLIILAFLFVIWLFLPPGNKLLQVGYFASNIKYQIDKIVNKDKVQEYKHLRNNAIFVAKMYPKQPKRAIILIDKAIAVVPAQIAEREQPKLYKDRAYIKLFLNDKSGALNDFLLSTAYFDANDNIRIAALLTEKKQYKLATKYCDDILTTDIKAFYGYACLSYVYEKAGFLPTAIALYDLSIDKNPGIAKAYTERARLKKLNNDIVGYEEDLAKARSVSQYVDVNSSLVEDLINLKSLNLQLN